MSTYLLLFLAVICMLIPVVVLIGIVFVVFRLDQRLGQASWFRKLLAVIVGMGVYIVAPIATLFFIGFPLLLIPALDLIRQNLPQEQFATELSKLIDTSQVDQTLVLFLFAILSGYIAGKIARQNEIVFGFITGLGGALGIFVISLLMGLPLQTPGLARVILAIIGGYLAFLQRTRKQKKFDTNDLGASQMFKSAQPSVLRNSSVSSRKMMACPHAKAQATATSPRPPPSA